jgi:hypothetical protein
MSFDELIKYIIWIVVFGIALAGVLLMLKRLGVV